MRPEERIPIIEDIFFTMKWLQGRSFQVVIDVKTQEVGVHFPEISKAQIFACQNALRELELTHIQITTDKLTDDKLPLKRKRRGRRRKRRSTGTRNPG